MKNIFINVYACCLFVKGTQRATICDIQRNIFFLIPNALYELQFQFRELDVSQLYLFYGSENRKTVEEYLDFLIENDFAFYCNQGELECFPVIDISAFYLPNRITNCILELDSICTTYVATIIDKLCSVDCSAIEIRLQNNATLPQIENLLTLFNDPNVSIVEVHIIIVDDFFNIGNLKFLFEICLKLTSLTVANAKENVHHDNFFFGNSHIIFTTRSVHLPTCCGNFYPELFTINLPFFTESQKHNTCLNRKIAIDKYGNIKNCPSMVQAFGNIKDTHLIDVIQNPEFTAKWNINKDQISICKDCEFRHICMDCRAYLEKPEDIYSKPLKCGYDPYTMEWEEWSTNPLKQKAIQHYGLKDII